MLESQIFGSSTATPNKSSDAGQDDDGPAPDQSSESSNNDPEGSSSPLSPELPLDLDYQSFEGLSKIQSEASLLQSQ